MRRISFLTLLVLLSSTINHAQETPKEKPVATVSSDRTRIDVSFKSGQTMPAGFIPRAGNPERYSLVELEPAGEPGTVSRDRTAWLRQGESPRCTGSKCQMVQIGLDRQLPVGQTFILAISEFTNSGEAITLRFDISPPPATPPKAEITTGPSIYSLRSKLQLKASEDITVTPTVEVKIVSYKISDDGLSYEKKTDAVNATSEPQNNRLYVLHLDHKLTQGKEYLLQIDSGIANSLGQSVLAEGTVKVPGIPTKPEELGLDINISSNVAVHQKAILEGVAKYKRANFTRAALFGEWRWEPSASVDMGLRSTKSANSVLIEPFTLVREFFNVGVNQYIGTKPELRRGSTQTAAKVTSYGNFVHTPWYKFSNLKFSVGPKFEFDKNFKRKNMLGSTRLEFNFHRWHSLIAEKREILKTDFGEDVGARARLKFGMQIVPFVAFDFGGHVNNETVHKTVGGVESSVFVPRHKIFRTYVGFTATFEFEDIALPLTLTIEESLLHLGRRELIGFTNDNGAFLRSLKGFHHRGKATFALALDPSKHFNLTLTYENGRQAPNLEYLNKLVTGIKILY